MFINDEDYKVVIGDEALRILSQASAVNRRNAEMRAIEEMSGYMRPVYDCVVTFAAEGESRNPYIVMLAVDIALYHLVASTPQRNGIEIRKERYDRAIEWLKSVQTGDITPDLPLVDESDASMAHATIYSSEPKLHNIW